VSYWLKMIGAADFKLEERPFEAGNERELETDVVRFPRGKVPRELSPGDQLIYYAVVYQRVFAVAQLDGEVEPDVFDPNPEVRRRWPDAAPIHITGRIDDLRNAPYLANVSLSLQDQIHQGVTILPMGAPEFQKGETAIRKARAQEDLIERRHTRTGSQ
jgi:hypothetical protein